ncbi:NUDIX hydrolase [Streptomyces odontomachi]|uniref:NUDIX hydrolase n=1 Tax=Streptomyces odontomachi TaxID=2944940 RepID=UPI00210EA0AA|nr:NUDIX hydrolase [Streptomyces sp. ODS25]
MASGQWYPPEWPDRIRALASGELEVVPARRAATVMLLRDTPETGARTGPELDVQGGREPGAPDGRESDRQSGPDPGAPAGFVSPSGPAVHMLRRRTSMPFAAGAYAYPGGGVDPRDDDVLVGWAGPSRAKWADRLGVDEAAAQAIVCAAVRETFEESGVLLAGPAPDALVSDITSADWEADRAELVAHELSFAEFLARRGLVLRSDLLGAWARWITPEFESRRYDTWFFAAALPAGQRTAKTSGEADRTVWISPAEAAARYDARELMMLPPTIATLRELSAYGNVAEILAAADDRDLTAVMAQARLVHGEVELIWPGYEEFTRRVRAETPVGAPGGEAPADASRRAEPKGAPAPGSKDTTGKDPE